MDGPPDSDRVAQRVLDGFERFLVEFGDVTRRARERFEGRDWPGMLDDMVARLQIQVASGIEHQNA